MKKLLLLSTLLLCVTNISSQEFDIYVSDAGNFGPPNTILKFDSNGENPEVFIDQNLNWPQDILFLEDQEVVLISNLNTNVINKHDSNTGEFIEIFATVEGGPTRMNIGPEGLIYVLQWSGNGLVLRYQQDGTFVDEFTDVGVTQSIGLDWDNDNNLYVSSFGGGFVRKFAPSGNDLGIFINSQLTGPTNFRFDNNEDILILDWSGAKIERFDDLGNHIDTFITDVSQAEGIDFYPNGDFLIGHGQDASVKLYNSDGTFLEEIIESGSGGLIRPNAVILRDASLSTDAFSILKTTSIFENSYGTTFKLNKVLQTSIQPIEIYDLGGRLVTTVIINSDKKEWEVLSIVNGVYLAVLQKGSKKIIQKIIITR